MKRKKINIKVPTYKFGLDQIGGLANIAGTTLSATGNDTASTVGGALSGAATGAAAGAALGPIGAVAGGVIGGATSLISSSAKKKAADAAKRKAQQQSVVNAAIANTADIQQEYGQENQLAYTFANGGVMQGGLAYVNDGEVIQYPNGNTVTVPEQGQSVDQNLTMLPEASTILSDSVKLKPLGNKTPAQYYKDKSNKVKYGTDVYAENSARLNKKNNDTLYNDLLMLQSQDNYLNNRTIGTKSIPKYANGKPLSSTIDWTNNMNLKDVPSISTQNLSLLNNAALTSPTKTITSLPTNYSNPTPTVTPTQSSNSSLNLGGLASLVPVAYNFAQSFKQPELEEPVQNPYTSTITSTLAKRRYNINPMLQANARSRAITNYNLGQIVPNTGASMAQRVQTALGQYNANMDLYGTQQNMNNQYVADYTNMLNSLGQQSVQAQTAAATQNRTARAKQGEYLGAAATQFGKWAQVQQQMAGQRRADAAVLPALEKFLAQGYTMDELSAIMSNYQNLK